MFRLGGDIKLNHLKQLFTGLRIPVKIWVSFVGHVARSGRNE